MSEALMDLPKFTYHDVPINAISCEVGAKKKSNSKYEADRITFEGIEVEPTDRFWNSFCSKFQLGTSVFRYYKHEEVFDRIVNMASEDDATIRLCIQETPYKEQYKLDGFKPRLLAMTKPGKGMLNSNLAMEVLNKVVTEEVSYRDGVILTRHAPRNDLKVNIGPDDFKMKLTLETPIDGYGDPSVFLSMLRTICVNGAVAYTSVFRSKIPLGGKNSAAYTVQRVIESYNNEDGFIALQQRFKSSQESYASLHEAIKLGKIFSKIGPNDFSVSFVDKMAKKTGEANKGVIRKSLKGDLMTSLWNMTGDLRNTYGVAQLDTFSEKRMRALPTSCSVYDLINLATEVATHQVEPNTARKLQGYFGDLVASEFDLESSKNEFGEFSDFIADNSRFSANPNLN